MRHILRQFEYLTAAANLGSFRRAAEMCGVDQSIVSRSLKQLEDHLGVALFERAKSGVQLTLAGHWVLAEISPAVEQLKAVGRCARAVRRSEFGALRLGILTTLAGGRLRELVQSYIAGHPRVIIDVRDGSRREHLTAVMARQLDAAIVTGLEAVPGCETRELWRERVYVALSERHPLAVRPRLDWPDLRTEQFIVGRGELGSEVHTYIARRSADHGIYPNIEEKAVSLDTLMNLVSLGQGMTFVSMGWTVVKVPGLVVRPLTGRADVITFSIVWSAQNRNPAFLRFLEMAHRSPSRHQTSPLRT